MQIQLKQHEIELAIKDYISRMGVVRGVDTVTFTAGRGGTGITAEIQITDLKPAEPVVAILGAQIIETDDDDTSTVDGEDVVITPTSDVGEIDPDTKSLFGG